MAIPDEWEITDVLICGCGPTGAMLSGYLGKLSVNNVVLEREPDITTDPRGIALDEEGIRYLQGLGLYEHIYSEIGTCMEQFQFVSGTETKLAKDPFVIMDYSTTEGGTGHVGFICHKQPTLEKYLRQAMTNNAHSELKCSATVTEITEDKNWVYCVYTNSHGQSGKIKAKFFVGADGKTGFTRKNYLEPRGVVMERAHNSNYEETWVALNWRITLPTKETHPQFPLWKLGYSSQDVYDAFFPMNFRFLCNSNRPAVCGRFGLMSDRLWRFEFVVLPGEDGIEMSSEKMIDCVVFPYLRHKGARYGLPYDVVYPKDCIEVLRCRPFTFSARSCNRWAQGRVILCGDAAHVFPPFGGQGIASGFRDAVSLAWRLSIACDYQDYGRIEPLLRGWYRERKQQLEKSLSSTIENGEFVTARNPLKILWRDWYFWFLQLFPPAKHQLHLGSRREGMTRYGYEQDLPFMPELDGGKCLAQVYCVDLTDSSAEVYFTDDVIWHNQKKGLFQLLVLPRTVEEIATVTRALGRILSKPSSPLAPEDMTIIVNDVSVNASQIAFELLPCRQLYRVATGEEFAASQLCNERPKPKGYWPSRLGKEVSHHRLIILRPDRFVFAACNSIGALEQALEQLRRLLE